MKKTLLRLCIGLAILVLVILSIVLVKTARFASKQISVEPISAVAVDENLVAQHLADSLAYQTISFQDPAQFDHEVFLTFHQYIENTFPQFHTVLKREMVGDFSLLYTWEGQSANLKPILLMAHMDVVPIESGTEENWTQPPFGGKISDGYIWGRGAIDDKASLMGILEAVEWLLGEGYQPKRAVYLAFGHDEEVGGYRGAQKIATLLDSKGVELEYVLDEGLAIVDGVLSGISQPVAMVGIAEKGYLSVELSVKVEGGHSAMPSGDSTIGILSSAIHRLVKNPLPARLSDPVRQMFDYIGPEMNFVMRMIVANQWLFGGMIKRKLASSPITNATVRTVTSPTVFHAGVKENVLPREARAIVNFRLLPGDSLADVMAHAKKTINDTRIEVTARNDWAAEPSFVSDTGSPSFSLLLQTIHQVFPDVLVAPGLMMAGSDSKHYDKLSRNIYRFVPFRVGAEDIAMAHGTNERIAVKNYTEIVNFYIQLIRNSNQYDAKK